MQKQRQYAEEMEKEFSDESRLFHGRYFQEFHSYLIGLSGKRELVEIEDRRLYEKFEGALLDVYPKTTYINEPWRYFWYYNAFKFTPVWLRDRLMERFMQFPEYKSVGS